MINKDKLIRRFGDKAMDLFTDGKIGKPIDATFTITEIEQMIQAEHDAEIEEMSNGMLKQEYAEIENHDCNEPRNCNGCFRMSQLRKLITK